MIDLLERDEQRTEIAHHLESARRGRASTLLMMGDAGIGKSSLLDEAARLAEGFQVLRASATETESTVPYFAVDEFTRALRIRAPALDQAHQATLDLLWDFRLSDEARYTAAVAVLELLTTATSDLPILVLVDDAHWCDSASMAVLSFVSRRLLADPVAVVIAARPEQKVAAAFNGLPHVTLTGLSPSGTNLLYRRFASRGALAPEHERALHHNTGGNPLAIWSAATHPSSHHPVHPPDIGEALRAQFADQLKALPQRTRLALLILAACSAGEQTAIHTAWNASGVDAHDLGLAEAAGLIEVTAGITAFRHPLVRSAVYHDVDSTLRRRAHMALAEALITRGADTESRTVLLHLFGASAGTDPGLAERLEELGTCHVRDHSFGTAVSSFEAAAALSDTPDARSRRLLAAADAAIPAGMYREVDDILDRLRQESSSGPTAQAARHLQARLVLRRGSPRQAFDAFRELADTAGDSGPAIRSLLAAEAGLAAVLSGDAGHGRQYAARAEVLAEGLTPSEQMPALVTAALVAGSLNRPIEATTRLALALPHVTDRHGEAWPLIAGLAMLATDDLHGARRVLRASIDAARSTVALEALPAPLSLLAHVEYGAGDWTTALAAGAEAIELLDVSGAMEGDSAALASCRAALATIQAATGRYKEATQNGRSSLSFAMRTSGPLLIAHASRALGLAALAQRDDARAVHHFTTAVETMQRADIPDSPSLSVLADLFDAQLRAGNMEAARETAGTARRLGQGASGSRLEANALRCCAQLPETTDAPGQAARAVDAFTSIQDPFQLARAHFVHGQILRRMKQRALAQQEILRALDIFEALGAAPWHQAAAAELAAAGGPKVATNTPHGQRLTPQEYLIAERVATGASNTEIAAHLFLSRKTVEYHLGNVYRKLSLRNRTELAQMLATIASSADDI
jgi:DNA-binding NarL/FixJ family response regulator